MDTTTLMAVLLSGGIPRAGLLAYWRDGVDTIGVSIADKPNIREELWPIFFVIDGETVTKRDDADIVTLALASDYLNLYTLISKDGDEVVIYSDGTVRSTLNKALRWAGQAQIDPPNVYDRYQNTIHYTNLGHYI